MRITMLVVQGRPKGKCLNFSTGEFVFGRGDECHVRPNSPWVSRQHCLLRITGNSVLIQDLGSTNGSLVNGQLITAETELKQDDRIQVGPLVLQLIEVVAKDNPSMHARHAISEPIDSGEDSRSSLYPVKSPS